MFWCCSCDVLALWFFFGPRFCAGEIFNSSTWPAGSKFRHVSFMSMCMRHGFWRSCGSRWFNHCPSTGWWHGCTTPPPSGTTRNLVACGFSTHGSPAGKHYHQKMYKNQTTPQQKFPIREQEGAQKKPQYHSGRRSCIINSEKFLICSQHVFFTSNNLLEFPPCICYMLEGSQLFHRGPEEEGIHGSSANFHKTFPMFF